MDSSFAIVPDSDPVDAWKVYLRLREARTDAEKRRLLRDAFRQGHRTLFRLLRVSFDPYYEWKVNSVPWIEADDDLGDLPPEDIIGLMAKLRLPATDAERRNLVRACAERSPAAAWNLLYRPLLLGNEIALDAELLNGALAAVGAEEAKALIVPVLRWQTAVSGGKTLPRGEWWIEIPPAGERGVVMLDGREKLRSSLRLPQAVADDLVELSRRMRETPCVLDGTLTPEHHFRAADLIPLHDYRCGGTAHSTTMRHSVLATLFTSGVLPAGSPVRVQPMVLAEPIADRDSLCELASAAADDGATCAVFKRPNAGYRQGASRDWRRYPIDLLAGAV